MTSTLVIPTDVTQYLTSESNISTSNTSNPDLLVNCDSVSGISGRSPVENALTFILTAVVAVIMVGIGCSIDVKKLIKHFKKPTGIITGVVCQYVLMPILGYMWAKIFTLEGPETLSIMIVGSCPGGTFSNIVTYWIAGDMELSTVMTTISVILSLGMLPLLLFIYSHVLHSQDMAIPFSSIGITIALTAIPIGIGIFIRYKFPRPALKILKVAAVLGMIAIVAVTALVIYIYHAVWTFDLSLVITAIFYPVCGGLLGYGISSIISSISKSAALSHRQRRAVSIETSIQNAQLALTIIQLGHFSRCVIGRVMLFPMLYGLSQVVWAFILVSVYHIFYYCMHGECAKLTVVDKKEKTAKGTTVASVDNPTFDEEDEA